MDDSTLSYQDISERSQASERLYRELEDRIAIRTAEFDAIFEATTVAIAYLDRDFRFVRVNRAYATADDHEPEYYVGKPHFELFPSPDNQHIFEAVRDGGEPYTVLAKPFEYAHNPERGVTHWDWTLAPVRNGDGHVTGLVLVLTDVTARVEAIEILQQQERRIAEQLAEKELLLREIHHRVKNNLQVVSSLLYLQSLQVKDEPAARGFAECRNRIRAMSLVHEVLCEAEMLERVDFTAYLDQLIAALRLSYAEPELRLAVEADVRVSELDVNLAVSVGLLTGELMTNALRHAFIGRSYGRMWIRLQRDPYADDRLLLEVGDDGIGLSDMRANNLGLRLVRTLVAQIDGKLRIDSRTGTRFFISFPAGNQG